MNLLIYKYSVEKSSGWLTESCFSMLKDSIFLYIYSLIWYTTILYYTILQSRSIYHVPLLMIMISKKKKFTSISQNHR